MAFVLTLRSAILSVLLLTFFVSIHSTDLKHTIKELFTRVQKQQWKTSQPFTPPPLFKWATQKGLYESYIHFNVVGKKNGLEESFVRNEFKIPDMNNFVTSFVQLAILETIELESIPIELEPLQMGLDAILSFRDKNYKQGIPIYTFWPERLAPNRTDKLYENYPVNLNQPLAYLPSFAKFVHTLLKISGQTKYWPFLEDALHEIDSMMDAFHIPPDTDDSSVNVALGATLVRLSKKFPALQPLLQQWNTVNIDYNTLYQQIKAYAYQPFSQNDNDTNDIDPRSYLVLRRFLEEAASQNRTLILPATWLLSKSENKQRAPNMIMPFNVNNVDLSVVANFIFGCNNLLLFTNHSDIFADVTLQQMYKDSIDLLVWSITSEMILQRTDIAILYYPSIFDYFWFIARNAYILNQYRSQYPLPEAMEYARNALDQVSKQQITNIILKLKLFEDDKYAYWDDFLGDFANVTRGEDRLFSTSQVINTLLDIWTQDELSCKRGFVKETPVKVKQILSKAVHYVQDHVLELGAKLQNAFFSGSVKSAPGTLPFFYPANVFEYLNGTKTNPLNPSHISSNLIDAMKHVVSSKEYDTMLKQKWFGVDVPIELQTYNNATFPFWSSPPLTQSLAMLSFAKYEIAISCSAETQN